MVELGGLINLYGELFEGEITYCCSFLIVHCVALVFLWTAV